jgi:hypothetical protein
MRGEAEREGAELAARQSGLLGLVRHAAPELRKRFSGTLGTALRPSTRPGDGVACPGRRAAHGVDLNAGLQQPVEHAPR